jgi:hypothetical protein
LSCHLKAQDTKRYFNTNVGNAGLQAATHVPVASSSPQVHGFSHQPDFSLGRAHPTDKRKKAPPSHTRPFCQCHALCTSRKVLVHQCSLLQSLPRLLACT